MTWGQYTRRVVLCILAGDVTSARATAITMWGAGNHFTAPFGSYFCMNAACTIAEAQTWRTAVNSYTGVRWYIIEAETNKVLDTNSPNGVKTLAYQWKEMATDLAFTRHDYYVSVNGSGNGSQGSPWSLAQAIASNAIVPGDVVHLAAGTYTGDHVCVWPGDSKHFVTLDGTGSKLNGTLHMQSTGAYVRVLDLEVLCDEWTTRNSTDALYPPTDIPNYAASSGAVKLHMPNVQLINMKVHDTRIGCGNWKTATNAFLYGCLHWHNGWFSLPEFTENHGEGWYCENETGVKVIQNCMGWNNFDHNLAIFGTHSPTDYFHILDNIWFNDEIQLGGHMPVTDLQFIRNACYITNDMLIGFGSGSEDVLNHDVHITDNIFSMPTDYYRMLWFYHWQSIEFKRNIVVGNQATYPVYLKTLPQNADWDYNTYYYVERTPDLPGKPFYIEGVGGLTFEEWKACTGYDTHSTFTVGLPPANQVVVHLNDYDSRRAHVAIYNWTNANSVNVDLSGLPAGSYRAFNVQNFVEYFDFTAGAAVSFRMTGWTASNPIGHNAPIEKLTFPQFGAWLVVGL